MKPKLYKYNDHKLIYEEYQEDNFKANLSILVYCLLFSFIFTFLGYQICWSLTDKSLANRKIKQDTLVIQRIEFNEANLVELIKNTNIKYPYIVLAQFKLESNNYTSNIFKENFNLAGMKEARVRTTTALCTKNGHACYRDWVDCVYDYAMYQNHVIKDIKSEEDYFKMLSDRYAEDPRYVSVIKDMIIKQKLKRYFYE